VAGQKPLYRDLMTWRAVRNALAGLLAGVAGGVLLGGLIVIWGVTLFTLATSTDDWEHVAVYVGIVLLVMALTPWVVHGLSAMQRSRLRATLGAEIPAPVRPLGRTWHQLAYHLLAVPTGLAGGLLVILFPVAPWLASQFTQADEGLARTLLGPGGRAYVSTPNVLTLAPAGAERSGNPWHVHEYRAEEFAGLLFGHFSDVELYGLFHARKLRLHDWMLRAGWDAVHPRVGLTGAFYSRFTPAISERDFALRAGPLDRALDFVAVLR